MKLAILDVGHGNCAVLYEERREAVVIDCPPGDTLIGFLRKSRVDTVSDLVISHADGDHCGGVAALMNSGILVQRIWILDERQNGTIHYKWIMANFKHAQESGSPIERDYPTAQAKDIVAGESLVEFVGPNHWDAARGNNRNRLSVVARISINQQGVALLPGDLDWIGYQQIDRETDLSAYWLVAPHHGGGAGGGDSAPKLLSALIERCGAKEVVFSIDEQLYDLPRPELLDLLRPQPDVQVRCTQLSSHCQMTSPPPLEEEFHDVWSKGFTVTRNSCCAGSIVLSLPQVTWSKAEAHDRLTRSLPGAQCR